LRKTRGNRGGSPGGRLEKKYQKELPDDSSVWEREKKRDAVCAQRDSPVRTGGRGQKGGKVEAKRYESSQGWNKQRGLATGGKPGKPVITEGEQNGRRGLQNESHSETAGWSPGGWGSPAKNYGNCRGWCCWISEDWGRRELWEKPNLKKTRNYPKRFVNWL